jgi:glycosyltransferase involved in cell wall biosynthesis
MSELSIIHFERLSAPGCHSIERVFETVRSSLRSDYRIRVIQCPTPVHSRFWLPLGIWRVRRARADVMHIVGDVHYVGLGLPPERTILTVHDLNRLDGIQGLRKILYEWIYFTLPLRRCKVVTAISDHTRNQLIRRFPWVVAKIQVIPDSIPYGFGPQPKPFNPIEPRILQIGTAANKNLARLAESLQGRRCFLQIVGRLSEQQRRALQRFEIQYANVVDIGDSELIQLYEQADIVAFTSLAEGFGMPIVEAQAIGRPVLASNLSPMKEVAGPGACLVDPYSVAEIRSGLDRIIESELIEIV